MQIAQAVKELQEDIKADGFDADIMAEIAADNGVNVRLLERKFTEQFGVAPQDYVAPTGVSLEKQIEAAKRRAAEYAETQLTKQGSVPHGIVFKRPQHPDRHYVTVAFMGNYLIAIRVETNEVRNITFNNRTSCEIFLGKQGITG